MALWLILVYFIFLFAVGGLVNRLLAPVFGRWWRLFVAPGVIVHEVAHVLGCILTGAKVHEINFWKPSGGHVLHSAPRSHVFGPVLISFAPTILMTIVLVWLLPAIGSSLGPMPWADHVPSSLAAGLIGYGVGLLAIVTGLNWQAWASWLAVYGVLNIAVSITPSAQDLANARGPAIALVLLLVIATQLLALTVPLNVIWPPLATSMLLLGIALVVAVSARLLVELVRRLRVWF